MRNSKFLALAFVTTSSLFFSSAFAQSGPLAARLTGSDNPMGVGGHVAISGDVVVASGVYGSGVPTTLVFQKQAAGWGPETEKARLTTTDGNAGGTPVISGDTIFVAIPLLHKVYVYQKPASGWTKMHETAQLTVPNAAGIFFGEGVAVDGDTVVVRALGSTAYVFVKPAGGWVSTSTPQAQLTVPGGNNIISLAVSGNTVVAGSYVSASGGGDIDSAFVFQKPEAGWSGTPPTVARLARSAAVLNDEFARNVAVFGNTIAISASLATVRNKADQGVVDLFVKPATGWADAIETVELYAPPSQHTEYNFGDALAMNSSHLLVGSTSDRAYVYSKPAAGWGSFEWPSQKIFGKAVSGYGEAVALDKDTIVVGAPLEVTPASPLHVGAAYVFPLQPNPLLVDATFLEFPDMTFGGTEKLSLAVTNPGTQTLNFTTSMDAQNYQVLQTDENTCLGGVAAGQSCVLPIEFNPPAVGRHTNHLILTSAASGALRIVTLRGYAGGVGAASEATLQVAAEVGSSQTAPLVLANFGVPGLPTVALSFSDPSYSLASAGTCVAGVPEGGTCTVMIRFAPTTPGQRISTITLTPSSGAASTVFVQGFAYNAN